MSALRILIVGSNQQWSIERLYGKYLKEAGITVELFSAQDLFYQFYEGSFFHKVQFRLGFSSVYSRINEQLLVMTTTFKPDIVWVFKGMEIFPDTLTDLKTGKTRVVSYNPDNPFLFTGKGSGNANVTKSIPLYDLHFTYSLEIEKQLQAQFRARTSYLPFGYDIPVELYQSTVTQEEILKCCFLGNPDKERAKFIRELAEAGVQLDLFGNFWDRFVTHSNVQIHPPVYGDAFYKTLYRYRVQLNMMRIHNLRSHNMRSFEIPAIGGIQLAPDTPEHRAFYKTGTEIFLYNNTGECIDKINMLLSLPAGQALEIRRRSRARSVESGYSYRHRSLQALEAMNALLHE